MHEIDESRVLVNVFTMLKFFTLCALVWQYICVVSSKSVGEILSGKTVPCLSSIPGSNVSDTETQNLHTNGENHFHAIHQTFYLIGQTFCKTSSDANNAESPCACNESRGLRPHLVSLKLHLQTVTWDEARKICIEEGGHLAVIRTDEEERMVLQMMTDKSVDIAWLGLHDRFGNGVWISIFDEPVDRTGWARWSTRFSPNPSTAHCATILKNGGGMTDNECALEIPFVCKESIS